LVYKRIKLSASTETAAVAIRTIEVGEKTNPYPKVNLALTLLMAWVGANNVDLATTAYDLTVFTDSLHTGADFHRRFSRNWTQLVKRTSIWAWRAISQGPFFADSAK